MHARKSLALILALSLTSLALAPTAAAREESESYTTGADAVYACSDETLGSLAGNLGSACFAVQDGDATVSVEIDDIYMQDVGGAIQFKDADRDPVNDQPISFCGSIDDVSIPSEAASLEVFVNGPTFQFIDCGVVTTSTFGDVLASFA